MYSIRTRITAITVCVIMVAMLIAAGFGVTAIKKIGIRNAEQTLLLLCETGQKNLDQYFSSVEQAVKMLTAYIESDLDGDGFVEHEVTDISSYDTNDTSSLVWFTVPKATGKGVWLPLCNGMHLNVTVPVREINADWQLWRNTVIVVFALLLLVFAALMMRFAGHITRPLQKLTAAARQIDEGNYDIELADSLGMEVLTEGVETRQQLQTLADMGCDNFQGYYFSRPIPVEEFEARYTAEKRA